MGNTHAFYYRLPALFAASFATCALGLLSISGADCAFVEVAAHEGKLLYIPDATEPPTERNTFLGLICINPLYEDLLKEDLMFMLSRICLFVAIGMGSFTCILSWALSFFVTPTEANWKLLSVFAAVSAVLQMPVFLIFETDPCTAFGSEQQCYLSTGSVYLILSTGFWVIVTLATQFLDPPRWADELNAWRTKGSLTHSNRSVGGAEGESQAPLLMTAKKPTLISGFQRWSNRRRWAASAELPKNQTDSLSERGEDEEIQQNQIVKYYARTNSSLVLNVLPSGKRPGDDTKSVQSFEDLDSIVRLVEEGRLPDCTSLSPPSRAGSFASDNLESTQEDPTNLQMVVWDDIEAEEIEEKRLVNQIYNDLEEDAEPVLERQLVVPSSRAVSQFAPTNEALLTTDANIQPSEPQVSTEKSPTKPPNVIKNLTDNLKRRSRVRRSRNNKYALMDDDDSETSRPALPTEVIFHNSDSGSLPDLSGTPTKQAEFPCYDETAVNGLWQNRSFENETYPDPIISMGSFESSTDEDEPDPIISSTFSMDDSEDGDSDSDASTDSSNSGQRKHLSSRGDRRHSKRRRGGRGYSSVRSVVSSTSLLDTMIAEETDADLLEFELEDATPYDLVRSQSAPVQLLAETAELHYQRQQIRLDHDHASVSTLGSSAFQHSSDVSDLNPNTIQLAPIPSMRRSRSLGSRRSEISSRDPSGLNMTSCPDSTFDTEQEDPEEIISFSSSVHLVRVHESALSVSDCEEQQGMSHTSVSPPGLNLSESTSDSFEAVTQERHEGQEGEIKKTSPPAECVGPVSPALTAPETPSPDTSIRSQQPHQQDLSNSYESEKSWKVERQLRGGIHAVPLDDSGDSSNEDADASFRVREARIRRLQREKQAIKRGRAQSHDPLSRRRPSPTAMSSVVDKLDLQLIEVLRPDGVEYGPDERSL